MAAKSLILEARKKHTSWVLWQFNTKTTAVAVKWQILLLRNLTLNILPCEETKDISPWKRDTEVVAEKEIETKETSLNNRRNPNQEVPLKNYFGFREVFQVETTHTKDGVENESLNQFC